MKPSFTWIDLSLITCLAFVAPYSAKAIPFTAIVVSPGPALTPVATPQNSVTLILQNQTPGLVSGTPYTVHASMPAPWFALQLVDANPTTLTVTLNSLDTNEFLLGDIIKVDLLSKSGESIPAFFSNSFTLGCLPEHPDTTCDSISAKKDVKITGADNVFTLTGFDITYTRTATTEVPRPVVETLSLQFSNFGTVRGIASEPPALPIVLIGGTILLVRLATPRKSRKRQSIWAR